MNEVERLSEGKYLSLTTFRKDGTPVATPVWVARDGETLVVTTERSSGKAKRLRNSSKVLLAPCDMRGKLTGDAVEGTAELLGDAGTERVSKLIGKRYGLQFKLIYLVEKVRRRARNSIGIRITPAT